MDPPPAPPIPRWRIDWHLWGDMSDAGWSALTLWDRVLARSFLPPDAPDVPAFRSSLAAAGAPLSPEDCAWFLRAPAHKAPDPVSQFKMNASPPPWGGYRWLRPVLFGGGNCQGSYRRRGRILNADTQWAPGWVGTRLARSRFSR